ncbi:MAG TPA: YlxR family protein [Candidatus Dormibacteraeota bacterium]|nr:YlxR family protein [Candidatus Dormibacteraeota bacterium]
MARGRHEPVRTCVGCRGEAPKRGLVRLVRRPDGVIELDPTRRAPGRGAYLHPDLACVEMARRRRALERSLRAHPGEEVWERLRMALSDPTVASPTQGRPRPQPG